MCADSADTYQIVGGLVSDVGQDPVDQGLVPLKLVLYCVTEKTLSDLQAPLYKSTYSFSLSINIKRILTPDSSHLEDKK